MKHWISILSLGALLGSLPASAQHSLTQLWQTPDLPTPESVLYVADKSDPYLFVALIDGDGSTVDGKGGVAKLATDGSVIDKDWVTGLNAPKGMAVHEGLLYVADITEVVVIDTKTQKIVKKIPVADSVFLNDVTVNDSGVVYVSDTRANKVHEIVDGKPSLYLDNVASANGLKAAGANLIVGAGPELLSFGADKKRVVLAKGFAQGIDGIEPLTKEGEFIVSCWPGLVYHVSANGKLQVLIDSQAEKINTADIGYDPETNQVFVPNFFKNTVTAYQLK
jgi:hypothetical protein